MSHATEYLLVIWGDVDPEIEGPFNNEEERDQRAGQLRSEDGDENGVFKLTVDERGIPDIVAYSGGEMDDLMDEFEEEEGE